MHRCLAYTPYYIQHIENSEYEPGQKLKKLASQLVLLKSASSVYSRRLGSQLYTKYTSCYLMLSKWAKWASTQWKLLFFLLENWFPFIFHLCFMLYILVLKICLKYVKHYVQLSQMSKMSRPNSRSRTQYIILKLVPLDLVPSNWGKR